MEDKFFIDSLWILENKSGICLFEENYSDYFRKEGISTDLIGSFFSALLSFAGETFTGEIQHIKFENYKIIFEFTEHFLFILSVSDKTHVMDAIVKRRINLIAKSFNQQYLHIFEEDPDGWDSDISIFNSFSEDLRKIVKREPLSIKFMIKLNHKDKIKKIEEFLDKRVSYALKQKERLGNLLTMGKGLRQKKHR